jgi:primosomal protein N'
MLNTIKQKYTHIKMRNRINNQTLPDLKVINMSNRKKNIVLADEVISSINNRLENNEQTLIFLIEEVTLL